MHPKQHRLPILYPLVFSLVVLLWGCSGNPKTAPKFLREEIEKRPAGSGAREVYGTNCPFGGGTGVTRFAHKNNLFAGTLRGGIFRSGNGGRSWEPVNSGLEANEITDFIVDKDVLIAGTRNGIFRSADDGATWKGVTKSVGNSHVEQLVLFGDKMLATILNEGVLYSDNRGESWIPLTPHVNGGSSEGPFSYYKTFEESLKRARSLAVVGDTLVAAEGGNTYRSKDIFNWKYSDGGFDSTARIYSLTEFKGNLYAGIKKSFYRSTDAGRSWMESREEFTKDYVRSFVADNQLCVEARGSLHCAESDESPWTVIEIPDTQIIEMTTIGNTVIVGTNRGIFYREKNNFSAAWQQATGFSAFGDSGSLIKVNRSRFVISGYFLYRSDNDGESDRGRC